MAQPGWYPDPGGAPGRFRYWDGTRWAPDTVARPPRRRGRSTLILFVAITVVLVMVGVIAVRAVRTGSSGLTEDPDPPRSSVSGWDDSSPIPTAEPSPSSPADPTPTQRVKVACAEGDPGTRSRHPDDGRAHGGRISIADPGSEWQDGEAFGQEVLPWAYDVSGFEERIRPAWVLLMLVGEVRVEDGFRQPEQAARAITQCFVRPPYYPGVVSQTELHSKAVTIDGVSGWSVRTEVKIDDPAADGLDDLITVVVLDTGPDGAWSFFVGDVPPRDKARVRLLDDTITGIRVD